MSNGIRQYEPAEDWMDDARRMYARAMVGGENYGASVQLTIGDEFTVLSEKQMLDLMAVFSKRLAYADGFSATDTCEEYTVRADGTKTVEETTW